MVEKVFTKQQYKLMNAAIKASFASTCFNRQVGSVIVNINGTLISSGNNGGGSNFLHCKGEGALTVGHCYYEGLAKAESARRNFPLDSDKYWALKNEYRLFCFSICAERRAIMNATVKTVNLKGATMYCTTFPCPQCAHIIRGYQFKEIFFLNGYNIFSQLNQETARVLREGNVSFTQMDLITNQGQRTAPQDHPNFTY